MEPIGEQLRQVMRHWAAGVAVVTSAYQGQRHGMTVNSFTSLSLDPAYISVTLANQTRTHRLVSQSGILGVTILHQDQKELADRFAGKVLQEIDRFEGLPTFNLVSEVPLIEGGIAHLDCRVIHQYGMENSTLFVGEVLAARSCEDFTPLIYFNRTYHRLMP